MFSRYFRMGFSLGVPRAIVRATFPSRSSTRERRSFETTVLVDSLLHLFTDESITNRANTVSHTVTLTRTFFGLTRNLTNNHSLRRRLRNDLVEVNVSLFVTPRVNEDVTDRNLCR